eukprot:m.176886 g.176886  ORF g.176886 m.176886 type:complete len:352 (+) comp31864_c5_seq2:163-1218(+)
MVKVHVAAGSYGHVLYGYDIDITDDIATFEARYSYEAHVAGVTSLAISGKHLASGSSDEIIKIYDLAKQKEYGTLMEHQGTITCLEFFNQTHLLSGSEDGSIMVWDTTNWECLKVLKGHTGAVEGLSIHASGRLALSVGRDRTLHVWNLVKGRRAYVTKLPHSRNVPRLVKWTASGDAYGVAVENDILLYNTLTGEFLRKLELPAQILSFDFYADGSKMAVGTNSEDILIMDTVSGKLLHTIQKAHENRVKILQVLEPASDDTHSYIISTSSDGHIKLWKTAFAPETEADATTSDTATPTTTTPTPTTIVSRKLPTRCPSYLRRQVRFPHAHRRLRQLRTNICPDIGVGVW